MPHRQFHDTVGRVWDVWEVIPERLERRRRPTPPGGLTRERRHRTEFRATPGGLTAGWLCFETGTEKRRLAPVPAEWAAMSNEELDRLCRSATPSKSKPRRLLE
ncbi:MAG TPA: hypothetical protein VII52_13965 [Gemmatimonadaceae bacterium]